MSDGPRPIYLDNAATTRPLTSVIDAMRAVHLEHFGNPSSGHGFGEEPRRLLADAREFIRGTFCAADIVFTSGGTEADLLGILGAASVRRPGRVLVGRADHPAMLAQRGLLERLGHQQIECPVGAHGTLDPTRVDEQLGADVRVVAVLHGHNELGSLADLDVLVSLVRNRAPDAHLHVDLVQAYGKVDFDLDRADVDSAAISAHKFHGPRGIGCLALSSKARIGAVLEGGGQEGGRRGGTENVAGAVGMATAAEHCFTHLSAHRAHMSELCELAFERIVRDFGAAERLGDPARRLPHILSMRIPGVPGAELLRRADARGVAFSTGSACHAAGASPVLTAIGLEPDRAREVIRLSVASDTDREDVERAAEIIVECANQLDGLVPSK